MSDSIIPDRSTVVVALLAIIGTLAGATVGQVADLWKTERLRRHEARIKARELAWNQTSEWFQKLFGMRIRLRADINTYREASIRAAFHGAVYAQHHLPQEGSLELQYRAMVDEYTGRVIDDRSQLQAILGWIDYTLPQRNHPLHKAIDGLLNLSLWYAPRPVSTTADLPAWADSEVLKATASGRTEIETKFGLILTQLNEHRDELLRDPAARYIRDIDE